MTAPTFAITLGARLNRPQGRRLQVDGVEALVELLAKSAQQEDAWWAPGTFRDSYRDGEGWNGAGIVGVDLDYHNERGEHAPMPDDVAAALGAAIKLDVLPGNLAHRTPRGARVVFVLSETLTNAVTWEAVAAGACALSADAIHGIGLQADPGTAGLEVDKAASCDRARLFFVANGTVRGAMRAARVARLRSALYSVVDLVGQVPTVGAKSNGADAGGTSYGRAALAAELTCVESSAPGNRSNALNGVAFALAQLHAGGELPDVRRSLLAAVPVADDFTEAEARRTIESGWSAGLKHPRSAPKESKRRGGRGRTLAAGAPDAPFTDLGNRDRFVARHGEDLRYCRELGWLAWNGARWKPNAEHEATERAAETVRTMLLESVAQDGSSERDKVIRHALKSESKNAIRAMVELAQSHPSIRISQDALDADPWLLNVANGTIDLHAGTLRGHQREDYCTKLAPVSYDPDAEAPRWLIYLSQVQPDPDIPDFLRRYAGYCATGSTGEQVFVMNHGGGANGKSVYEETMRAALGDYAVVAPFDTFLRRRTGAATNDLASLRQARLVVASEPEEGVQLSEAVVKKVTGGDSITARFLHREFFTFKPACKLMLSGNHRPRIRGTDHAIWRRVLLVPWPVTISKEKQDRDLSRKLRDELPGILVWIVQGCLEWQREGLIPPAAIIAAVEQYRESEDHVGRFIADRCSLGEGQTVTSKTLRDAYLAWCEDEGEEPLKPQGFGPKLTSRGLRSGKVGPKGARAWHGIALVDAPDRPDDISPHTPTREGVCESDSPTVRHTDRVPQ